MQNRTRKRQFTGMPWTIALVVSLAQELAIPMATFRYPRRVGTRTIATPPRERSSAGPLAGRSVCAERNRAAAASRECFRSQTDRLGASASASRSRAATPTAPSLRDERDGRHSYDRAIVLRGTRSRGARAAAPVLSRQCARRRSPIRAGARARRSARPSGRAWPYRPRGPDGDRQAVASRPRSRSRRRSAPARDGRCRPAGPPTAEANVPALAGQFPQYAADGVLGARAHLTAARNQGALFRLTGNRRWPHCGPMEHPDRADPPAARS